MPGTRKSYANKRKALAKTTMNSQLSPENFAGLNRRLNEFGIALRQVLPPGVDVLTDLHKQTTGQKDKKIAVPEIVEYEVVGLNGEDQVWVNRQFDACAEEDKQEKIYQAKLKKEREEEAELAAAVAAVAVATDDDEDDKETAVESDVEYSNTSAKGKERAGSAPPLVVSSEPIEPAASDDKDEKK